ncbi:MAG: hypothetical protein WCD12_14200 [Candidatus Binatus sp.]|uniref:hypothetical protein n=1 Tax=Candidatus Binatus sp. TaxID=2811406 RepID=UPI003C7783F1
MLADRDAFIVFYNLAYAGPVNIAKLCEMFMREPAVVSEILEMLCSIGLAHKHGGLYEVTDFGGKALKFLEETAERIDLPPAEPGVADSTQFSIVGSAQAQSTATNNTIMSDFRATSALRSVGEDVGALKPNQVKNEPESKEFAQVEPPEPPPANGARSHNYL